MLICCTPGKNANLGLILTKFDSSLIVCRGPTTPVPADCDALLNQMPATDVWQEFGSRGDLGVDVGLPYVITERGFPSNAQSSVENKRGNLCHGD